MSKKLNVLIFPCGSEIALELHRALKHIKIVELYGISSVSSNAGKYFFKNYHEPFPFINEPGFIDALNAYIEKHNIDAIFPSHDDVVLTMARNKDAIKAAVLTSPYNTCDVSRNKLATYKLFEHDEQVKVPKIYEGEVPEADFPVFVKPKVGQGSKGAMAIKTNAQLQQYIANSNGNYVVMEQLTGKEYTVDCYSDKNGVLKFVGARVRNRTINGISSDTFPVFDPVFETIAEGINRRMDLKGPWFYQVKHDKDGVLKLLEISPRTAGSMALARNMGVNIPLLAIYELLGYPVNTMKKTYGIRLDRSLQNVYKLDIEYDTVYIDFDDCILLDESNINLEAIQFVYQVINEGKRIELITRHKHDISVTLEKFRLSGLFDAVHHLRENEPKHQYIQTEKAIFIDDSFRERRSVAEKHGIPVFDVCEIECLLNKKM